MSDRQTGVFHLAETTRTFNLSAFLFLIISLSWIGSQQSHSAEVLTVRVTHSTCFYGLSRVGGFNLVVEGAGDVTDRFYLSALLKAIRAVRSSEPTEVTFLDESRFWSGDPALSKKMAGIRDRIQSLGWQYKDKSRMENPETELSALRPNALMIATPDVTHADLAMSWLRRGIPTLQKIYIEKPLDASIEKARELIESIRSDVQVYAFDHYRMRAHLSPTAITKILDHLGGDLENFEFYLLEDRSGADPTFHPRIQRDGAIENEQRVKALRNGVSDDLLIHMYPLLEYFGYIESMFPTRVRAGRYRGVDGDPLKPTEIAGETYAHVDFEFMSHMGNGVRGSAYVGKGISGSRQMGSRFDHNVKALSLYGINGKRVIFDLRSSGEGAGFAYLLDADGNVERTVPLNTDPYELFFSGVLGGNGDGHALSAQDGLLMLERNSEIKRGMVQDGPLPLYDGGMSNGRRAPSVEELKQRLRSLPLLSPHPR